MRAGGSRLSCGGPRLEGSGGSGAGVGGVGPGGSGGGTTGSCKVVESTGDAVPACQKKAPAGSFSPEVQWTWTAPDPALPWKRIGSFVTPLVANFTDDNGDSLSITEIDSVSSFGSSVEYNDNGTPDDTSDDYIVYTPDANDYGTDWLGLHYQEPNPRPGSPAGLGGGTPTP